MLSFKERKAQRKRVAHDKEIAKLKAQTRKPQDIQIEYNQLCSEAGDKQYRIKVLTTELDELNARLYKLNQEFSTSRELYADELKAQAEEKSAQEAANVIAAAEKNAPPQEITNAQVSPTSVQ